MRAAIYLVVAAAGLCAGCKATEPAVPSDTPQIAETAASSPSKPLGQGRSFFGIPLGDRAKKIVFVMDGSGSMTCPIECVQFELKRCIGELGEDTQFHVVFYSSAPPVEMPTRRLVRATQRNKALAGEFIDAIVPQGEADPAESIKRALALEPDCIYLLTDGEFDRAIIDLVKRNNPGGKVTVHTIGYLYRIGQPVLKKIAAQNNGNYRFISEADLAAMFPG
ncbi:MAG TPA: VWA domain-containing protein [Phycisphaerae bacterium]|nr:VWA domain-containing protein [Phycisphaerae bacterium]